MISAANSSLLIETNRLDIKARSKSPLLATYFALGDPYFGNDILDVYVGEGVDIIELGAPTANPHLDGPDVANAMARSLGRGEQAYDRLSECLERLNGPPMGPAGVCMAYNDLDFDRLDPQVLRNLDGLLMIDGERRSDRGRIDDVCSTSGIRRCGLAPFGFTDEDAIAARSLDGYVMLQASPGVTGPRPTLDPRLGEAVDRLRRAGVTRPILLGFGIATPEQARQAVALGADGVVVGSMCVRRVLEGRDRIRSFLSQLRAALDGR